MTSVLRKNDIHAALQTSEERPAQPGPTMMSIHRDDTGSNTGGSLSACPACGCRDLFVRKDFPQKLGLAIVLAAGVAFIVLAVRPRTFYIGVWVLVGSVVLDGLLYFIVPRVTVCYRCRKEFRRVPINPAHGGFELAVAE